MGAVIRRLRYLRSCNFYLVLVCGQRYKTAGVGRQCGCYWTDYSIVSLDGCINDHCLGKLSRGVRHVNCHVSNRGWRCLEHCIIAGISYLNVKWETHGLIIVRSRKPHRISSIVRICCPRHLDFTRGTNQVLQTNKAGVSCKDEGQCLWTINLLSNGKCC